MDNEIRNLTPKNLWEHFYQLTQIPHPSGKEKKIIAYIKEFADKLGLENKRDAIGNLLVIKPATPGMENHKMAVLQAHVDMVPQKNSDTKHDFEKDPIKAYIDDGWVTAKATTLGADNGIGVAATMAILESKDLKHGPIEALFTIEEETGLTGAFELQPNFLNGDILINMDSEQEGELFIGCAGGLDFTARLVKETKPVPENYTAFEIKVSGLKGGHSGLDIHLGRANAIQLLNRIISLTQEQLNLVVAHFQGGDLRNAIPREASAWVLVPTAETDTFTNYVQHTEQTLRDEFKDIDPDILLRVNPAEIPEKIIDPEVTKSMIHLIEKCPNGVIGRLDDMPDVVETSTNLAVVKVQDTDIVFQCLLRSSVDEAKKGLSVEMKKLFNSYGAKVELSGEYPGWIPNPDSAILKVMKENYKKRFSKVPEIKVMHAGLECGIIGSKYPGMDMISFGPTIKYPHSPDEKVDIKSVEKFWDLLVLSLNDFPQK